MAKKYFEESVINEKIKAVCNEYNVAYGRFGTGSFSNALATITEDMPVADVVEINPIKSQDCYPHVEVQDLSECDIKK